MSKLQTKKPDYGNWISEKLLDRYATIGLLFLILSIFHIVFVVGVIFSAFAFSYFVYARYKFSPRGGNIQEKIRELTMNQLSWNGKGRAVDIGCGNAPLTISIAKKFPAAEVIGVDYWGGKWDFSEKVCEKNAEIEGVKGRTKFQKASAAKLPFEEGYFDVAVSNLVFHEVSDAKDKRQVIKEALRVVKKGGKFSFQDPFLDQKLYGNVDDLLREIKSWGVEDVNFVATGQSDFIPNALRLQFMLGAIGVLYGTK